MKLISAIAPFLLFFLASIPVHAQHQHHSTEPANTCTPEHAAMGHCTLPEKPSGQLRESIPELTDADRAAAFPELKNQHQHMRPLHWLARLNQLETWDGRDGNAQAWSGDAWLGGDVHRLRLLSEGERSAGHLQSADFSALYSRSVTPWWDWVAGIKHEFEPDARTWAAVGVQGLAPYFFEVSVMLYADDHGQIQFKLETEYELLLTNRLILQPMAELTASLKNEPEARIGSGFGSLDTGLRLRYEITRQFAPYLGIVHERHFGNTAQAALGSGGHPRDTRIVAGVRVWF